MNTSSVAPRMGGLLPVLAAAAFACGTSAQAGPWTSVGSAGVPDEASVVFAHPAIPGSPFVVPQMSGPVVSVGPVALPRTARLRYNIVDVFDRQGWAGPIRLSAKFVDNGTDARVLLYLYRHDFTSNLVQLLLKLDSNTFAPSSSPQNQSVSAGCAFGLDFRKNAYWIEAALTRSTTSGTPAVYQLRVEDEVLC